MASTLINGNRPSWQNIVVELNGEEQPRGSFLSLNYGANQEVGVIQSNSRVEVVGGTPKVLDADEN